MSLYAVHKVAHAAGHDPEFRERLKRDPEGTLAGLPLTGEERQALLDGDVGRLAEMGAHGYLLGQLAQHQCLGLTVPLYTQRIHDPLKR